MPELRPGRVALLGSGETSPSGGRVFEAVVNHLTEPPRVAVLETGLGFEHGGQLKLACGPAVVAEE